MWKTLEKGIRTSETSQNWPRDLLFSFRNILLYEREVFVLCKSGFTDALLYSLTFLLFGLNFLLFSLIFLLFSLIYLLFSAWNFWQKTHFSLTKNQRNFQKGQNFIPSWSMSSRIRSKSESSKVASPLKSVIFDRLATKTQVHNKLLMN